jgi:hypothetical protein
MAVTWTVDDFGNWILQGDLEGAPLYIVCLRCKSTEVSHTHPGAIMLQESHFQRSGHRAKLRTTPPVHATVKYRRKP